MVKQFSFFDNTSELSDIDLISITELDNFLSLNNVDLFQNYLLKLSPILEDLYSLPKKQVHDTIKFILLSLKDNIIIFIKQIAEDNNIESLDFRDIYSITKSYIIATLAHENQKRSDGTSYLEHPIRVARLGAKFTASQDNLGEIISTYLMHDVLEDSDITSLSFQKAIKNKDITSTVENVSKSKWYFYIMDIDTKNPELGLSEGEKKFIENRQKKYGKGNARIEKKQITGVKRNKEVSNIHNDLVKQPDFEEENKYFKKMKKVAKSIRNPEYYGNLIGGDLKLYDRLESFATMHAWTEEKIIDKIKETKQFILPVAEKNNFILYVALIDQINEVIETRKIGIDTIKYHGSVSIDQKNKAKDIRAYLDEIKEQRLVKTYSKINITTAIQDTSGKCISQLPTC